MFRNQEEKAESSPVLRVTAEVGAALGHVVHCFCGEKYSNDLQAPERLGDLDEGMQTIGSVSLVLWLDQSLDEKVRRTLKQ